MAKSINISYNLDEFMQYKQSNMMLPSNLKSFCNDIGGILIFRDSIVKEALNITNSFLTGKNPNDIIFKNSIIELMNKITQKNYQQILESLKTLSYTKSEHFITLATDILIRAMTDPVAVKGIDLPPNQQTLSEIYLGIVIDFFPLMIVENEKEIKFSTVFLDLCKRYFDDFADPIKPLDQNNAYRVDNFKGFTNFLGLLYSRGIINGKVLHTCMTKVVGLIFSTTWGATECENAYEGYRKMLNHVILTFEKKAEYTESDKKFIDALIISHEEIKTKNKTHSKLRRFTMMYHDESEKKLTKLNKSK
jgi:hypothetical protein